MERLNYEDYMAHADEYIKDYWNVKNVHGGITNYDMMDYFNNKYIKHLSEKELSILSRMIDDAKSKIKKEKAHELAKNLNKAFNDIIEAGIDLELVPSERAISDQAVDVSKNDTAIYVNVDMFKSLNKE